MEVSASQGGDIRNSILDRVASSNAFFKSQQLNEKDLTFDDKRKIAETLLETDVPTFLQRYWNFLDVSDVVYFEPHRHDYQVNFYLSEIMKLQDNKTRKVRVKNRRYEALRSLMSQGSYFSESEMKKRNPLLYEQLVGQYLSESERAAISRQDMDYEDSFANFLLRCIEKSQENYLLKQQQDEDDAVIEEQDDDESESDAEEADTGNKRPQPTDEEKEMMRNEFRNIMYENFLAGKDLDFDYSTVDNNVEYDSLAQREIDEEEKYFDEDSSDTADNLG